MGLPEAEQTRLYERYWSRIEALFRGASRVFDSFARDYMALRTRSTKQVRADAIYQEFRSFFRQQTVSIGLEPALESLLESAQAYSAFLPGHQGSGPLHEQLRRLRQLAEVAAILVMRLGECHRRGTMSSSDFEQALELLA